jgi:hypothetical protein
VVTGAGNCVPLNFSTSTTFALIIRLRYVAAITRFSSSTKLMEACMGGKLIKWICARTVRSRLAAVNRKL